MAANDPVSTLQIWEFISGRYLQNRVSCIFFNSREDRPSRTHQMIQLTLEKIKPGYFFIRGDKIKSIVDKYYQMSPKTNIEIISLSKSPDDVICLFDALPDETLIYAIGNQVGAGQKILEKIAEFKSHG